jgi:hypothetical protein
LLQIEFSNKYGLSTKDYHQTFEVQEGLWGKESGSILWALLIKNR